MATRDPKRVSDGWISLEGGCDQGRAPNLIQPNQCAFSINTTFRGGWPTARPAWVKRPLTFESDDVMWAFKVQGPFTFGGPYRSDDGLASGISVHGGRFFKTNIENFSVQEISISGDANPSNMQIGWGLQAENFWLFQDGQSKVFCYNGGSARRLNERELPVGKQMAYHMGRVWVASPSGRAYVAGDIVFGPPANNRSSILGMTENQILSQGGAFGIPIQAGVITGMKSISNMNTAIGQGPLIVFTDSGVFASMAPVNRAAWQTTTQPLQVVVQEEGGGTSQDSIVNVNDDLYFRTDNGVQSLAYAVRNNGQPGNTPISNEVEEVMAADAREFLQYGSGVNFDNRLLMTCSPAVARGFGIYHRGLVALDFDLVSGMRSKSPPAWDGMWTGLNWLKLFRVRHKKVMRCFAYVLNAESEVELWELTRDGLADNNGVADVPIQWRVDGRSLDFGSKFNRKRLFSCDLFIDRVSGEFTSELSYRPDGNPCEQDWDSWSGCAKVSLCAEDLIACEALPNFQPQYRPQLQARQPADTFDAELKRLHRVGYEFQPIFNNEGRFRMKQFRVNAYEEEQPPYGDSPVVSGCPTKTCCTLDPFAYSANGGYPQPREGRIMGEGGELITGEGSETMPE